MEGDSMRNTISRALVLSLMVGSIGATLASGQGKQGLPAPTERRVIYPENVDAKVEIAEALANATKTHRRVILVFGGNWCYDCHALDAAFRSAEIAPIVNKNFVVVHVNIGEYDKNLDVAEKYDVPLKGVCRRRRCWGVTGRCYTARSKGSLNRRKEYRRKMWWRFWRSGSRGRAETAPGR